MITMIHSLNPHEISGWNSISKGMKSIPFYAVIKVNEKSFIFLLFSMFPYYQIIVSHGLDSAGDCHGPLTELCQPLNDTECNIDRDVLIMRSVQIAII